ncbi:MAG: DinB family protein [Anaerolineae bacterium]|nr:DinB family protein [Anaerolineae bacterium]
MNALDILKYGHFTVVGGVKELPEADWETDGVCGIWSVKQIMAHLASYEQLLVDILKQQLGSIETPALDRFLAGDFNDGEVNARQKLSVAQTWAEYEAAQAETMTLMAQLPETRRRENGILPWYGAEYDLEDFIAYMYYGHKREHTAQIAVFRDMIKR